MLPSRPFRPPLTTAQIQTFKKRAAEIADHAHNPRGAVGEGVEFLRGLDETERQCMCMCYCCSPIARIRVLTPDSVPRSSRSGQGDADLVWRGEEEMSFLENSMDLELSCARLGPTNCHMNYLQIPSTA